MLRITQFFENGARQVATIMAILALSGCIKKAQVPASHSDTIKYYQRIVVRAESPPWTATGISVNPGDHVLIIASGKVTTYPGHQFQVDQPPHRKLMMKIGASGYPTPGVTAENRIFFRSGEAGRLKFCVKDWSHLDKKGKPVYSTRWCRNKYDPCYYRDNSGSYRLDIFVFSTSDQALIRRTLREVAKENQADKELSFHLQQLVDDLEPASPKKEFEAAVQMGHSRSITCAAFSPNGRLTVSGSDDSTLKLWEVFTGREVRTFTGISANVTAVAFSPDGSLILSGHNDGTLAFWEVSTGQKIRKIKGHATWIHTVAFTPDNRLALSGSNDLTVRIWEAASGRLIKTLKGLRRGRMQNVPTTISFSPDARFVLLSGIDMEIREVSTDRVIRRIMGGYAVKTINAAFSPDGRFFSTLDNWGTLTLWEVSSGRMIRTIKDGLQGSGKITRFAFSPDSRFILTWNKEGYITLSDVSTGREIKTFEKHSDKVECLVYSPDGRFALTGHNNGSLALWEIQTGRVVKRFEGHADKILSVAYSPDGHYALCGSADRTVKLWNAASGQLIRTYRGHVADVTSVAFSPDGRLALSGSNDNTSKLWDISRGHAVKTLRGHTGSVTSVAFSPDGRFVMSGSKDETLKLWNIATGREIRTFKGHTHWVSSVAFSPDGRRALSGSNDNTLRLWDVTTGREISTFEANSGWVHSVAFSPDGRFALSGSWQVVKLWDIATGGEIRSFTKHAGNVTSVAFSFDGRFVLSGSDDNTLKLWEVSTGREIRTFKGHLDKILSVAFSPDGQFALSGSNDMTTRIWDVQTGKEIVKMMSSRDGEWITATLDGYYNTSPEGASLIHWVFSGGSETFTFEQFESRFRRPDIIKTRLAGDRKAGKPAPVMTRPPQIEMEDHLAIKQVSGRNYPLKLTVTAPQEIETVRVFVNGKPALEVPVNAREKELSLQVPLFTNANRITVVAYDDRGFSSTPKYMDVVTQDSSLVKPNLYVLGIGISNYPKLPHEWQLEFAHSDAQALAKALQGKEGKLFGNVYSKLFINEEATVENISQALGALSSISENDLAVVFMAGHGMKGIDGTFYFLTANGSFEEPQNGGVSWTLLSEYLARTKGRVILLLDACHSGGIVTETVVPNDELAQQFFAGGYGGVMVFSASKGRQFSMESPDIGGGYGVFTYALVQSLGPATKSADTNSNGFLEFMELVDYVRAYVDRETKGAQTPWLSRKELFGDLPLAMVN